jgi:pimeloyl-ACP methyl ester carboxylesterase
LSADRRVFAPDLPGYGESDGRAWPHTLDSYAGLLAALVDTLGLAQFDLGGVSLGGGTALTYALSHPERVRKLVLVDTYGIQPDYPPHFLSYLLVRIPFLTTLTYRVVRNRSMARATLGRLLCNPAALTDALVDEVLAEVARPGVGQAFNAFQVHEVLPRRLRTNYMPRLGEIRSPTLIVHGEKDTLVPLKYSQAACWQIPDCRLEVLRAAGHWAQRDQPDAFTAAVAAFLG